MEVDVLPVKDSEIDEVIQMITIVAKDELRFPEEALFEYNRPERISKNIIMSARDRENRSLLGVLACLPPEGGVMTILWLIVSPEYRKHGIGSILLDAACGIAINSGCHKIKLTTNSKEAVNFYKKKGMIIEGVLKNHWWHMDFWSMGKFLNKER